MADGKDRPEPTQGNCCWGSDPRAEGGRRAPRLVATTGGPGVAREGPPTAEDPAEPNSAPVEDNEREAGPDKDRAGVRAKGAEPAGVGADVVTPPPPPPPPLARCLRRLKMPSRAGSRVARGLDTPDPSPMRVGEPRPPLAPKPTASLASHWAARCCSWEHHWDTSGGLEAGPTPGAAATLALDTRLDTRARRGGSGGPTGAGVLGALEGGGPEAAGPTDPMRNTG